MTLLTGGIFDAIEEEENEDLLYVEKTYSELVKDLTDMKMSTYIALLEALRDIDSRIDFSAIMVKNWLVAKLKPLPETTKVKQNEDATRVS